MRIESFTTLEGQLVNLSTVNVLVGPNNVGKTRTLKDLFELITFRGGPTTLLGNVSFPRPISVEDIFRGLTKIYEPDSRKGVRVRGITSTLASGELIYLSNSEIPQPTEDDPTPDAFSLLKRLGIFKVSYLDVESRLSVANFGGPYSPENPPQRLLEALFIEPGKTLIELQAAFRSTFGMEIFLDATAITRFILRVSSKLPETIPENPVEAFEFMRQFPELVNQGDGFRSFVGVVLSLLLSEGRVILLDEPEAFLHPAQARKLGGYVAKYATEGSAQVIVATHNTDFLDGILTENVPVNIVRLNRSGDNTTFINVPADTIRNISASPLLSSQRVLDAFFHSGVVVCEADVDRVIYRTVAFKEHSNQNVLFLHSQNKQTVKDVVGLLRKAAIAVCAVVDIDILNSSSDFRNLLSAFGNPSDSIIDMRDDLARSVDVHTEDEIRSQLISDTQSFLESIEKGKFETLSSARGAIRAIDKNATRWKLIKRRGIEGFPDNKREIAEQLIDGVKRDGLWIVPVGELESWIDVGGRTKKEWIVPALELLYLEECPIALREFVGEILNYVDEEPF